MLYVAVSYIIHKSVMSIYSTELESVQVVINCQYSVAQMCTREDKLPHYLGAQYIDDIMRHNMLITNVHNILLK